MRRPAFALLVFAALLAGFWLGKQDTYNEVAAIADELEHTNAFGDCLVERWKAEGVVE